MRRTVMFRIGHVLLWRGMCAGTRAWGRRPNRFAVHVVVVTTELTVSRLEGVFAIERFAADIDRLNAASSRPNAFSSAAFLYRYALRNEYHTPGDGERLFLVREEGKIIGCAPMRQSKERLTPSALGPFGIFGKRLEFLAAADTEQLQFLSTPEDEERVTTALLRHTPNAAPPHTAKPSGPASSPPNRAATTTLSNHKPYR